MRAPTCVAYITLQTFTSSALPSGAMNRAAVTITDPFVKSTSLVATGVYCADAAVPPRSSPPEGLPEAEGLHPATRVPEQARADYQGSSRSARGTRRKRARNRTARSTSARPGHILERTSGSRANGRRVGCGSSVARSGVPGQAAGGSHSLGRPGIGRAPNRLSHGLGASRRRRSPRLRWGSRWNWTSLPTWRGSESLG